MNYEYDTERRRGNENSCETRVFTGRKGNQRIDKKGRVAREGGETGTCTPVPPYGHARSKSVEKTDAYR